MKKNYTGHEKIAYKNIKAAVNYIVGGYYNDLQDGYTEYLPESIEDLKEEIYEESMNNEYGAGYMGSGKAPKEMRFAGEAFCRAIIDELVDNDEDVAAIKEAIEPKEDKEMMNKEVKNTVTVALRAFTGMVIGEYEAKKTSKGYSLNLKNGKTMNFNKSGKQTNSKDNRFANYIEVLA